MAATPLLQLPRSATCDSLLTPFAAFALANCVAGTAFAAFIKPNYARQTLEEEARLEERRRLVAEAPAEVQDGRGGSISGSAAGYQAGGREKDV